MKYYLQKGGSWFNTKWFLSLDRNFHDLVSNSQSDISFRLIKRSKYV